MTTGRSGTSRWDPLPVRRVQAADRPPLTGWPATLAPVAQLLRDGLDLSRCTVIVGANGTGKSTVVEAIALAYGLSPEGGSTGARHSTTATESDLHEYLFLDRGIGASRWGYFVRAETMHGLFTYLDSTLGLGQTEGLHELSHGESFLTLLSTDRFTGAGFFVLDEPEAGLSFDAQLRLIAELLAILQDPGSQILFATHSPILAAMPGATVLEFDESGIHEREWDDLTTVDHYRRFLQAPQRYLRHL